MSLLKKGLYERAARALAEGRCPDFSDIDDEIVVDAFREAFDDHDLVKQFWLDWFRARVAVLSDGRVFLGQAEASFPGVEVQGAVAFLVMEDASEYPADPDQQKIILRAGASPFIFVF